MTVSEIALRIVNWNLTCAGLQISRHAGVGELQADRERRLARAPHRRQFERMHTTSLPSPRGRSRHGTADAPKPVNLHSTEEPRTKPDGQNHRNQSGNNLQRVCLAAGTERNYCLGHSIGRETEQNWKYGLINGDLARSKQ
jgi:hypothetical protein